MRGRPRSQGSSRSRLTVSKLPLAGLSSAASARSSARHVANKQRSVPVDTLGFEPRSALSRKLFSNYHMMQDMFAAADPGGRGVVTYRDFRTALAEIGVSLPKKVRGCAFAVAHERFTMDGWDGCPDLWYRLQEFNRILRLYDPSDSGVVDYRAFNKRLGKLFKPMANGQVFVAPFSEKKRGGKLVSGPPLTPTLAGRLETKVANQVRVPTTCPAPMRACGCVRVPIWYAHSMTTVVLVVCCAVCRVYCCFTSLLLRFVLEILQKRDSCLWRSSMPRCAMQVSPSRTTRSGTSCKSSASRVARCP